MVQTVLTLQLLPFLEKAMEKLLSFLVRRLWSKYRILWSMYQRKLMVKDPAFLSWLGATIPVHSRMIIWTIKHANKWLVTSTCHFNATFHPSQALSDNKNPVHIDMIHWGFFQLGDMLLGSKERLQLNSHCHCLLQLIRWHCFTKQVFRAKKLVGLPPQLELLAVFIHKSGHGNMSKQCNHIMKVWAHSVSLRHGHTDTDILYLIFFSVTPTHLQLYLFAQGRREFVPVQTVCAAGDNIYFYVFTVLSFSMQSTASKP